MKGIVLIVIGALTLAATRFGSQSAHNWLLALGLLCIVAGIILYIIGIKRDSRY